MTKTEQLKQIIRAANMIREVMAETDTPRTRDACNRACMVLQGEEHAMMRDERSTPNADDKDQRKAPPPLPVKATGPYVLAEAVDSWKAGEKL